MTDQQNAAGGGAQGAADGNAGGTAGNGQGSGGGQGGGGQNGGGSWRDALPADLRDHAALKSHADVVSLAKEHVNAQQLIGRKGVILPGENAKPEDWDKVYDALGRPKDPQGYGIKRPDAVPEDRWDGKRADWWAGVAHKAGLTPAQEKAIREATFAADGEGAAARAAAVKQAGEQLDQKLRGEWGAAYDANMKTVEAGLGFMGLDDQTLIGLRGLGLGESMIRALHKIGSSLGDSQLKGSGAGQGGGMTPEQIKAEQKAIRANPAYFARDHAEHKTLVARMDELAQLEAATQQGTGA